jgi:hypothetical protein
MYIIKKTFYLLCQIIITITTLTFFSSNTFAQVCHPDDYSALVRLRDATNGGGGLGSWNTIANLPNGINSRWIGPSVFNWHGIDTMHDATFPNYYRVQKINLDGNNFIGLTPFLLENDIPDSLFVGDGLIRVDSLILNNNNLTGVQGNIKTQLPFSSHQLEYLSLDNNQLSHSNINTFTFLLGNFGNLSKVYMTNAMGTGSADLSTFPLPSSFSLNKIRLEDNNFTGTLQLFNITNTLWENLLYLYLDNNSLTSIAIPSNTVGNLQILKISNNNIQNFQDLTNCLDFVGNLRELHAANAMDTSNTVPFILTTSSFPSNLQILDWSYNNLTGILPLTLFEDIPTLRYLNLANNNITGVLPPPRDSFATGVFMGTYAYQGLPELHFLDLNNNDLQGSLNLDWFFLSQIETGSANGGLNIPLEVFRVRANNFTQIKPTLSRSHISQVLSYNNRFNNFIDIDVAENKLDFKDLFRLKRFFRFKQTTVLLQDHYAPQSGIAPGNFRYSNQDSIGIGGIKRRNQGDSVIIEAGRNIIEPEQGLTNVLQNKYSWERINPATGIPLAIGSVNPNGTFTAGPGAHNSYAGALGLLSDSTHKHKFAIYNLDNTDTVHHNRLFTACVTNDSFPLLSVCMKKKKLEVGPCTDSTGRQIECQTMIVQFHPDTLAQYNPAQQDSIKEESRNSIGAKSISSCVCGNLELWEISDTASTMTESNGKGTKSSASSARGKPELLSAEPNYSLMAANSGPLPDTVDLPSGSGNTTSTTLVAIIDSGLDYEYSSLVPYISEGASQNSSCMQDAVWGYNFLDSTNNASDDHGHGTAIAGVVTGLSQQNLLPDTGNTAGSIGILPLKYTDKNGEGTVFHAACAIYYAADYERTTANGETARVKVINNSWGYYGEPSNILEYTISYAGKNCGILVLNSAGNDNQQVSGADSLMHWPSNSIYDPLDTIHTDNVLSVAAVDYSNSNNLASYSNYDNTFIDLAAQGTDNTTQAGSTNAYVSVSGTSFATAQVSRAAALLFDKYPDATYFAIKYALLNGVDVLQSNDSLKLVSGGRLNYHKADSILNLITDKSICDEYSDITSTQNIADNNASFNVYPNPVGNNLTIELDQFSNSTSIEIRLFNAHGQVILSKIVDGGIYNTQLPMQHLATGIYFIQLQVDGKQFSKKVIKD